MSATGTLELLLEEEGLTQLVEAMPTRAISFDAATRVDVGQVPAHPAPPGRPQRRRRLVAASLTLLVVGGAGVLASVAPWRPGQSPSGVDPQVAAAEALRTALERARSGDNGAALAALEGSQGPEVERARAELTMELDETARISRAAADPQVADPPAAGPLRPRVLHPRARRPAADSAAMARYREGDLAGAMALLGTGASGADLRSRLAELQRSWRSGMALSGARAIGPLEAARDLDRRLGGSTLGPTIRERLVAAHTEAAQKAGDAAEAYHHWSRVRELAPDSAEARSQLESLQAQARQLFLSAYVERESEPASAVRKLREVVGSTPAGEEIHEKARRWLERLDGASHGSPEPVRAGPGTPARRAPL